MSTATRNDLSNDWEKALKALALLDERLGAWISSRNWIEDIQPAITGDPYILLVKAIIAQQLSVKAAETIYSRMEALFSGRRLDFAGLAEISEAELRSTGLSARKVKSVKDLSRHILEGRLPVPGELMDKEDEEIIRLLCSVHGVGRWTAENFLIFPLGRMDVLPADDLILRRGFARKFLFSDTTLPKPEEVRTYAARWSPYRTAAAKVLWTAGSSE